MNCPHTTIRLVVYPKASTAFDPSVTLRTTEVAVPVVDVLQLLYDAEHAVGERFGYRIRREETKLLLGWRRWVQIHHFEYECRSQVGWLYHDYLRQILEGKERVLVSGDPDRCEFTPSYEHTAHGMWLVSELARETLGGPKTNVFRETIALVDEEISKAILGQSVPRKPAPLEDTPPERRVARCPACLVEVTHLEALGMTRHECRLWQAKAAPR